jgi:tetratricopeptide (TPR) repeat protein
MELIQNNPYRIAGILSNATERELQKQKTKIKAYTKVGKEIKSDFDFQILGNIDRTEDSVNKAFSNVEQNQDKVNYALFWFLNASPFDNTAIEYLKNGDEEKALEIWEKVTTDKDINSKNFSAFNNLGTYKLLSRDKSDIKRGIEAKIKLIESDYFESFVHSVADETYTIDNQKQSEKLIDGLLTQFKNQFSSSETLQLFSGCNGTTQKYLSKKFTEEPLHKIESQIESCKKKRKADKGNAYEFGLRLFKNTKDDLSLLKSLLGTSDLKYKAVADQLANEIMQCGIDYFNESHENDSSVDFLKQAQELNNTALSIAVGKLTRDRAKDSLATLEEMKDREVDQAIALLQSVKDAFETNEANIRRQIEELKQNDIELKFGLKTINYSAVEDNIKNSIDWSKVNDLLREVLSDKNLIKIKESSKTDAKNEFWDLVNWLEDNSLKSSTISTVINKYKKIPPKIFFDIISADITNTDSKSNSITEPFYVENIRYVGLKLNISSNGSQEVTIFKKYVNPDGKYKHSSNSPEGYTTSTSETITPQTKIIDLGGYGNGKECTYQVGEHKIEVYVEHFKVYTETFKVDWSPNKKSELKRKLEILQNELNEVKKFKWFRGSETKEREVKEVENKINKAKNLLMNK